MNSINDQIIKIFTESSEIILSSINLSEKIENAINEIIDCLKRGNKIIIFGNGGSAADSQHIAAELIGRFQKERKSLPAISLTTDSSIITSLANDYSYDVVFSRQCESLVSKGDVVIGISTSGNSKNVENGLITSKEKNAITIGLLGGDGGKLANISQLCLIIPNNDMLTIETMHLLVCHLLTTLLRSDGKPLFSY